MSRRPLLALVLVSVLVAPLTAASAATTVPVQAKPVKLPVLTGTVKVTATASAVMDVRLPKPVWVGDGFNPPRGTTITGDGRIIGALLLAADGSVPSVEALQYGFCGTPGCKGVQPRFSYRADDGVEPTTNERLPAGDYRLLIITDGTPVTVVFKLPGLKGTSTLKPLRKVEARQLSPEYTPTSANLPVNTTYIGAVNAGIDGGRGLLFHQMQVQVDKSVQQSESFCIYDGAYQGEPAPQCPGGRNIDFSFTRVAPEPSTWRMWGMMRYLNTGTYRAGMYYNALGLAHDPVGTVTFVTLPPR